MTDRPEWLQPPSRILVRHRSRLGRWYYLLRPFAIGYAALSWALREVLVWVVYVGWRVFWLINKLFAAVFGSLAWLLLIYTRLRYGREAANELRRAKQGLKPLEVRGGSGSMPASLAGSAGLTIQTATPTRRPRSNRETRTNIRSRVTFPHAGPAGRLSAAADVGAADATDGRASENASPVAGLCGHWPQPRVGAGPRPVALPQSVSVA